MPLDLYNSSEIDKVEKVKTVKEIFNRSSSRANKEEIKLTLNHSLLDDLEISSEKKDMLSLESG